MAHIALDVMGGDDAPQVVIEGALAALEADTTVEVSLVGQRDVIESQLQGYKNPRLHIQPATEVITNEESPAMALRRKKDSTIVVALNMVKDGAADAFVSAGSTGAVLTGSLLILKTVEGIHRPALTPMLPTTDKPVMLIDCGANVDAKPLNLEQFAMMGSAYMQAVEHRDNPRIGLVNVGAEAEKGNQLTKEVYPRLQQLPINFVGNIEARDILLGAADVVVCDAFVGNVILKLTEGAAKALTTMLKEALMSSVWNKLMALGLKGAFKQFKKNMDVSEYGGAPLLGVNGVVVKAHGNSDATSIKNAILQAQGLVNSDLTGTIAREMQKLV